MACKGIEKFLDVETLKAAHSFDDKAKMKLSNYLTNCVADCVEDLSVEKQDVVNCPVKCHQPIRNLENNIKEELRKFQNRVRSCALACPGETFNDESLTFKERRQLCAQKCVNERKESIHQMTESLSMQITKNNPVKYGANCCDDMSVARQDIQSCVEKFAAPTLTSDNRFKQNLQNMKRRFDSCACNCEERIVDKMSSINSPSAELLMSQEIDLCVGKCEDERI